MNDTLKQRLQKLTTHDQERRFEELYQKLGFAAPQPLNGTDPPSINADEFEEYIALKKILGYVD